MFSLPGLQLEEGFDILQSYKSFMQKLPTRKETYPFKNSKIIMYPSKITENKGGGEGL